MADVAHQWNDLLFGVRRSVRYHERRRDFFETWNLATSAISLLFGSAALYSLLRNCEALLLWSALIVTVASILDLVVGTSRMAHLHSDLGRRFIDLEKQMVLQGTATGDSLKQICAARLDIEKDEPPVKRALDVLCYNELVYAMGYDEKYYRRVGFFKRLTAHIWNWRYRPLDVPKKKGGSR